MKRAMTMVGGALLALAACSAPTRETDTAELLSGQRVQLSSGTSFGMCAGYCVTELTIEEDAVTLTETGHASFGLPPRTRSLALSPTDAEKIHDLVDAEALAALEGVHGCPDCADGGAEWIEIRSGSRSIRVTFEHGAVLPRIAELQAALRLQRARFQ